MEASSSFFSRVGLAMSLYVPSQEDKVVDKEKEKTSKEEEQSFSAIRSSELYPHKKKVVDRGCPSDLQSFPLLSGEAVEYVGPLGTSNHLAVSNYRFFVWLEKGFYSIPLGLIETVEQYSSKDQLVILCKDARSFCLKFDTLDQCRLWTDRLRRAIQGTYSKDLDKTFAFVHWAYHKDQQVEQLCSQCFPSKSPSLSSPFHLPPLKAQPYSKDVVQAEFYRLSMNLNSVWKITDCNSEYKLCPTYPKLITVPSSLSDEELRLAARFRAIGRLPAVVWRHPSNGAVIARSSQPLVGVLSWRSSEDEKLLMAVSQACALSTSRGHTPFQASTPIPHQNGGPPAQVMADRGQRASPVSEASDGKPSLRNNHISTPHPPQQQQDTPPVCPGQQDNLQLYPKLLVMDLRSYTAVLGNRAKGGGCECTDYYPNCEVQYKNLPNIHSVRKSFQQLRNVLLYDDQANFLSNLESTQWLHYLCQLISAACDVVNTVNDRGSPVLVHCSDGWDRTAQVVSLAELLLDPYYRTIEGFQVLVEREWVGFGHRFDDRCGQSVACVDSSQRSPVFLQWLDCVHQLILQFPCDFQFNLNFLVKLGLHCYSCLFGTLMANCMQERDAVRISEHTLSLWSFLHAHSPEFVNHLYKNTGPWEALRPVARIYKMQLWHAMFLLAPSPSPSLQHTLTSSLQHTSASSPLTAKIYAEEGEKKMVAHTSERENGGVVRQAQETKEDTGGGGQENAEARTQNLSVEMEMKEMVSHQRNSGSKLSEDSFTTLSRSSSPEDSDVTTVTVVEGEVESESSGDRGEESEELGGSQERKAIQVAAANNSSTRQSSDGAKTSPHLPATSVPAIATVSTHYPTSSSRSVPESPNSRQPSDMDTSLLHEALHDHSPHLTSMAAAGSSKVSSAADSEGLCTCSRGWGLDVDGMPSRCSEAEVRMLSILKNYETRISELKCQLTEAIAKANSAAALHSDVKSAEPGGKAQGGETGEQETNSEENKEDSLSPFSTTSWDCLDSSEGVGVRWVPDHAATHCQHCGSAFSLLIRKHHCRACGGVFCNSCTDFMCPVPDEQLYNDVRVCTKCFYRLDGHLSVKSKEPT